ncbi:MAG TPA: Mur ligase domain-containing protein, partial [Methylomirabilota bacterium]|nr:Mur ligase domain-containing protein [Methylomirabilota bacterium]
MSDAVGVPLRYHFSGIAGAGMNPLAQLLRSRGHYVQGSDRSFDQGRNGEIAARLRALDVRLLPQDGGAVTADLDRVVFSTAVEADTPELRAARALGLTLVPRPALLAEIVNAGRPGVALAGTSGKSTITGMVAWILRHAGTRATVLGGAALVGEGTAGCFVPGREGEPVVAEACESDGTLVGYRPRLGLVHNVSRDHAEMDSLRRQFATFARHCRTLLVNAACAEALAVGRAAGARTYGRSPQAEAPLEVIAAGPHQALGLLTLPTRELRLELPQPGVHNLDNAAAAALVALELGAAPATVETALACFPGVARRFEVVGTTAEGIRVVDDFAHNAEKIRAAVETAQSGCDRLLAVFQPHGFGPARFLRPELRALLPRLLRRRDRWCYAPIFYAGGTVAMDVSSRMLADDLAADHPAACVEDHAAVVRWVVG